MMCGVSFMSRGISDRYDHQNCRVLQSRSLWLLITSEPCVLWDEMLESMMHVDCQTLTQRHTQAPVHLVSPTGVGGNHPWIQDIACSINVADRKACCQYMSEHLVGDKASSWRLRLGSGGLTEG